MRMEVTPAALLNFIAGLGGEIREIRMQREMQQASWDEEVARLAPAMKLTVCSVFGD